ncbi:MAG: class I SAM-dependent methyltransferase [Flavobacteriia bacterium]|nr:class I SAM-dependent methyltransferase [Flavobacteriia bacterium]
MKRLLIKISVFVKGLIIMVRPHLYLNWLTKHFLFIYNTVQLSKWIHNQEKKDILNDFYTSKRDYAKKYVLHEYIINKYKLDENPFDYLEFGVFEGNSFKWWLNRCKNINHKFYGFDTFEGLPEQWGTYEKGEMLAKLPDINDDRSKLYKGLFQDTLPVFIENKTIDKERRKIIHLDADLFSSTIFTLTTLAFYIKKGDILIFDEFNVPNHEYFAFKIYTESFYVKYKLIGSVNNYYQVAIMIE